MKNKHGILLKFIFQAINFLILIFIIDLNSSKAQSAAGGIMADYLQQQNNFQPSVGFYARIPASDNICLNYRFLAFQKTSGGYYMHTDAGPYFAFWLLDNLSSSNNSKGVQNGIYFLAIVSALIPEGVGYYPDKQQNFLISVNPLNIDYWHRKTPYQERARLNGALEISYKTQPNKSLPIYIVPHLALSSMYNPADEFERWGIRAGVSILFSTRDEKATEETKTYYYD